MSFFNIVPIYLSDRLALLSQLNDCIEQTFHVPVRVRAPWFDAETAFDASRGQYNSTVLLGQLLSDPAQDAARVLGVTSLDLFSPALTYVFGEAQLNGRAALVSIERLRTEAYGLPADEALLHERLEKEAIHELGHTYGLVHCLDAACVMHSSSYAEQIDFKSAHFCTPCRRNLTTPKT
jgi:archaemetzincin